MSYKISYLVFGFLFTKQIVKEYQQQIKFGEYHAVYNDSVFIINIKNDSTFKYTKQLGKPIEFTYGKWRIEKNQLILQSVPDTIKFRSSFYSGKYVFFENKRYKIMNDAFAQKNNAQMKYIFSGSKP